MPPRARARSMQGRQAQLQTRELWLPCGSRHRAGGGLNARFTVASTLMGSKHPFRKTWEAAGTPQFIVVTLDGAGPFGDPYQVNSANNGPYGDAITRELIPAIESQFRAVGKPVARVLSGTSTGGWAALALQVFYPDYFNGVWSSCPDPVDFRALS